MLFVLALTALFACRKPEDDLGLDLVPGDALGVVVDTATLHALTYADSAIRTSGLTRNLLGSYLDPQFGWVRTGIVAQVRLGANNVGAGQDNSGLVADSIVLSLAFDGINYVYGNLNPQVFRVHELAGSLSIDSTYENRDIPAVLPNDLADVRGGRITPRPLTKPVINGDSLLPQLRIRLDQDLAVRFLSAFGSSNMANNASFLEFFKGIYITVDNGQQLPLQQGLLYFNMTSSTTKMVLYYHDTINAPGEALTLDLPIDQGSVRYTTVEHDHQQAYDVRLPMALADTSMPATNTFVQALGGLRTAIRFPALMDHAGDRSALAKAELIVPLDGTFNPFLPPPLQLFVFRKDTAGKDVFLPDQTGSAYNIDGAYRENERQYRFNITRYVQGVLNGEIPNNGIELVPASSGVTGNRALLSGPEHPVTPMRLRLTFTSF